MSTCLEIKQGEALLDESEALDAIERCVVRLASKFSFGSYEPEDIAQEIRILGLELLRSGRYNPDVGPVGNFLYSHIYKRLCNLKRDKLSRSDSPCLQCRDTGRCPEGAPCEAHRRWAKHQLKKSSLANPVRQASADDETVGSTHYSRELSPEDGASLEELRGRLDAAVPADLADVYRQLLAGERVEDRYAVERVRTLLAPIVGASCPW